ncbi:hypothetical protein AALP_AA6G079700 [Arabis alpina]|uniref:RING-type domain-containing protein n=1 Tax=Arabis alpina TaxID=50452 RepID=A0A087GMT4_ARAAL|nr:hypothetical protein AALP_AA6G079700 [Arabis alpina]
MDYSDDDVMLDNDSGEDNYHYTDEDEDDDGKDSNYEGIIEDDSSNRSSLGYVVLKEVDIHKHQRDDIEQVSTILSISQAEAIALLLHYRWSVSKVQDEWFTDEARVRKLVGYIAAKIDEGPGCLKVKCPEPSCSAAICQDLIDKVTNEKDKEKYDSEEAHSPVDCETVAQWILKNSDESENTNWILANTKPCPKCKRSIEKNKGCMHMTCTPPCQHQFCWMCLDPWKSSCYRCNKYDPKDETENKRTNAKQAIDRYVFYFERWVTNQSSKRKAMQDLEKWQSVQLKELSDKQSTPETQLQFTIDAWLQIIECRRVLQWTYAYGYYLPSNEVAKKNLFEYLQGEAQVGLERLHHCAEEELNQFVYNTEDTPKNFSDFRNKLVGLTKVTKTYFENLVKALENGLADVSKSSTDSTSSFKRQKKAGGSKSSTILSNDERLAEEMQLDLYENIE